MESEFDRLVAATIKSLREAADMQAYTQGYMRSVALVVLSHVYEAAGDGWTLPDPGQNLPTVFEEE